MFRWAKSKLLLVPMAVLILTITIATTTYATNSEINVLMISTANSRGMQRIVPLFEKETGIKVVIDLVGAGHFYAKEILEMGRDKYDVYQIDQMWIKRQVESDFLEPLDQYVAKHDMDLNKMFFASNLKISTVNGSLYTIPLAPYPFAYWYRKDVFKEKGIGIPETWERLLDIAVKLTDKDKGKFGFGVRTRRGNPITWNWLPIFWAYGGRVFDENMKPIYNNDAGIQACEMLKELNKCSAPGWQGWPPIVDDMGRGDVYQTTMMLPVAKFLEGSKYEEQIDFTHLPKGPAGRATIVGYYSMGIGKKSKNKENAFKLLHWLSEHNKEVAKETGYYPAVKSVFEDPGLPRYVRVGKEVLPYAQAPPLIPEAEEFFMITGTALQEILADIKSPKEAMDDAARELTEVLKRAGYYD